MPFALFGMQFDRMERKRNLRKYLANFITGSRIIGSMVLLFVPVFSVGFWALYLLCGLSDMIDGTVARKAGCSGELGAKLDTVADLLFVTVVFLKILPVIHIPTWLWVWVAAIAICKISGLAWRFLRTKTFSPLHTILNKITGLLLFLLPFTFSVVEPMYSTAVVCLMATVAAGQEGYYFWTE